MGVDVFVTLKDTPSEELMKKIDSAFKRVHDQTFKQRVNISPEKPMGEIKMMKHGVNFNIYENHKTIDIPCHWDYNHGVKTIQDIVAVLRTMDVKFTKARVSY